MDNTDIEKAGAEIGGDKDSPLSRSISASSTTQSQENVGEDVTQAQQWRILLSTSLMAFTVIGFVQAFGVFQAHYGRQEAVRDGVIRESEIGNRALISSIGSFGNGGLVALFGIFYYPRLPEIGRHIYTVCFVGTVCVALGFSTAASSHSAWDLFGSQGVLVGIGTGILIYILSPILPEYFPQRSGLAQGTMYAGMYDSIAQSRCMLTSIAAAVGGVTFSFVTANLLEKFGTRVTLGTFAVFSLVMLSSASVLAIPPRKFQYRSKEVTGWRAFYDPMFSSLAVVNFIHPLTLAIPMTFGPAFAESLGVPIKPASYLLAINNGVGIPSRLGAGVLADRIGHQNALIIASAVYLFATWTLWVPSALTNSVGLYVGLSISHGLISGVFNTTMNSIQRELFGDAMFYPKNGVMTSIRGIGYVVGVPIAGALVTRAADRGLSGEDFLRPITYTGSLLAISLACLLFIRRLDGQQNGWKWAR